GIDDADHLMDAENKAIKALGGQLAVLAKELSEKREKSAALLCRHIEQELASLNMPETRFSVSFQQAPSGPDDHPALVLEGKKITPSGLERPVFMISPNAGEDLRPLTKIASGGELSRVILAVKAILSDTGPLETIIFDEVDAGIGGKTAETVGEKLAALARRNQVICITHLAQIGKFADHHYNIEKQVEDGRTKTAVIPLDWPGRVRETARMIGGASITDTTLAHAEEMLLAACPNSGITKEAI
ncbi:MAG: DNA repair protein RecN, partial [Deltaproteobacteria bacterium]|nr:DNA repair protein RecN [Deltaproteobacteria bacterium]